MRFRVEIDFAVFQNLVDIDRWINSGQGFLLIVEELAGYCK